MTTPNSNIYSVITGSGSCIPEIIVKNADFANALFMNENGSIIELPGHEIVQKFELDFLRLLEWQGFGH